MAQLSDGERQKVTSILTFFYPDDPPKEVTLQLADLAAEMLHGALEMSKALDYVPRPTYGRPDFKWLIKEAVQMFWRTRGPQQIYYIAKLAVAWKYKSFYAIAQMEAGL